MDVEGLAKVIEPLKWPGVALVLGALAIVLLRGALVRLVDRLKGAEFENGKLKKITFDKTMDRVRHDLLVLRSKRTVRAKTRDAASAADEPEVLFSRGDPEEQALADAKQGETPTVVVERAWLEVERVLYRIVEGAAMLPFTYVTGNDLLRNAIARQLFEPGLLDAINGLLSIRNDTVTGIMGWSPSKEQASAFVYNAAEVVRMLTPYLLMQLAKEPVEGARDNILGT